jgi:hypothetical protein
MQVPRFSSSSSAGLLLCAAALIPLPVSGAAEKDAFPDFENYVTLSGQGNWVKGNKAAFEADQAVTKNGFGGIESFQYSKDLKNDFSVSSDGHLLIGNNDYLAHIKVTKNEYGSVDIGYKRFRTYYDNAGGFFLPTSNAWAGLMPFPEEMFVDRSKFWAEVNVARPNAPSVTLRYTNEIRNGRKDSTIWGATDYTGLTGQSNSANVASRFLAPGYLKLGEHHQRLEALAKHTIGNTTLELTVGGDRVDNLDTRYFARYPGEIKRPVIATTPVTQVPPANVWRLNNEIQGFDRLNNKADTFSTALKVETLVSTTTKLHASVSYSLLNSDFTQFRPLYTVTPYPTATPVGSVIAFSANAQNLVGGAKIKTLSGIIGADFKAGQDLTIETAIKGEDYYRRAFDTYQTVGSPTVSATGVVTAAAPANIAAGGRTKEKSVTPEISARYTGIRNVSLFGTAEFKHVTGQERVITQYNVVTATQNALNDDVSENHGRYTFGANWAPKTYLTVRAETFIKDHRNDFQSINTPTSSGFLLGYDMKGAKFSVAFKPTPTVTFTTRYIYQYGTMKTSTGPLTEYRSMDAKYHNLGETIDWTPFKQLYVQINANVVYDVTSTAYPRAGVSTTSSGINAVHNADNNYWNGSALAGFVLDKVTNAEIQGTYYKASNYDPAFITSSVPYGAGQREYTVTAGLKRKLTDKLIAELKVGYLNSKSETTGGNTNYTARIAYVSLQQAF